MKLIIDLFVSVQSYDTNCFQEILLKFRVLRVVLIVVFSLRPINERRSSVGQDA